MTGKDDLNDDLSDLLGAAATGPAAALIYRAPDSFKPATERVFTEPCSKCRGSGRFIGWSGRTLGACFECKGTGKHTFKTAPEKRAAARTSAAARKVRTAAEARDAFAAASPDVFSWLQKPCSPGFDFPAKMLAAVEKYGSLTDGQMAAVRRLMERDTARVAERAARVAAAPSVDMAIIETAFAKARTAAADDSEGIKWLSLRLDTFKFSDAPARGQYAAAVFVSEGKGESKRKLGRISGGKFHRSFQCDDATEARILAAAADPKAAAIAYGQRTGSCSVCGRELTNANSRTAGIGPICAEKYGW
jgi:hypothetical protein